MTCDRTGQDIPTREDMTGQREETGQATGEDIRQVNVTGQADDRERVLAQLAGELGIDMVELRRYADAEAAVWDAVRERDAAMIAQAEEFAREWAARIPMPDRFALVYGPEAGA